MLLRNLGKWTWPGNRIIEKKYQSFFSTISFCFLANDSDCVGAIADLSATFRWLCFKRNLPCVIARQYHFHHFLRTQIKDTELHFTVGRAMCSAALGCNSPEKNSTWTGTLYNEEQNGGGPVSQLELNDEVEWLLTKILSEYVVHRIPNCRQVCDVQHLPEQHARIKPDQGFRHYRQQDRPFCKHVIELTNTPSSTNTFFYYMAM